MSRAAAGKTVYVMLVRADNIGYAALDRTLVEGAIGAGALV